MNRSEIKGILHEIEFQQQRIELRKVFLEHGVKFFDRHGEGYIRDKVKHYTKKY
jgi:hypothetical protein